MENTISDGLSYIIAAQEYSKSNCKKKEVLPPLDISCGLSTTTKQRMNDVTHEKPKRPLSSYNLFFRMERDRLLASGLDGDNPEAMVQMEITPEDVAQVSVVRRYSDGTKRQHRKTHGKIGFNDLTRIISEKWKILPENIKDMFEERAIEEKAKYVKEIKQWKATMKKQNALQMKLSIDENHNTESSNEKIPKTAIGTMSPPRRVSIFHNSGNTSSAVTPNQPKKSSSSLDSKSSKPVLISDASESDHEYTYYCDEMNTDGLANHPSAQTTMGFECPDSNCEDAENLSPISPINVRGMLRSNAQYQARTQSMFDAQTQALNGFDWDNSALGSTLPFNSSTSAFRLQGRNYVNYGYPGLTNNMIMKMQQNRRNKIMRTKAASIFNRMQRRHSISGGMIHPSIQQMLPPMSAGYINNPMMMMGGHSSRNNSIMTNNLKSNDDVATSFDPYFDFNVQPMMNSALDDCDEAFSLAEATLGGNNQSFLNSGSNNDFVPMTDNLMYNDNHNGSSDVGMTEMDYGMKNRQVSNNVDDISNNSNNENNENYLNTQNNGNVMFQDAGMMSTNYNDHTGMFALKPNGYQHPSNSTRNPSNNGCKRMPPPMMMTTMTTPSRAFGLNPCINQSMNGTSDMLMSSISERGGASNYRPSRKRRHSMSGAVNGVNDVFPSKLPKFNSSYNSGMLREMTGISSDIYANNMVMMQKQNMQQQQYFPTNFVGDVSYTDGSCFENNCFDGAIDDSDVVSPTKNESDPSSNSAIAVSPSSSSNSISNCSPRTTQTPSPKHHTSTEAESMSKETFTTSIFNV